ncbi:Zinc finger CCCH domain-containing 27-like protein [Melia azedarach]|uniref:Zinc finger CCCH domain-containing 27-like protein n=1 Tax=Melia azedarach TaxID=155640 RepID=A0ACC1WWR4_MELAZ|nr:Zinc finger CCCH domain-containing 27-like protein [Melia azedarach]
MSTSTTAAAARADDDDKEIIEVEEVDDLSDSPTDVADDLSDVSKEMESLGHKSHLESGSSTEEKSKARRPSNALAVVESRVNFKSLGSSNEPFTRQKELSHENQEKSKYSKSRKLLSYAEDNGSRESKISKKDVGAFPQVQTHEEQNELHTGGDVHLCNTGIVDSETSSPSSVTRKNVTGGIWIRGRLDEGTSEEEMKPMDMHPGDDKWRMASRCLSPGAEINDGNKHPAVICDFYIKGWCIKGNSCRFLHVKDDLSNTTQLLEEDLAAATVKTEVQFDEGLRNETERSKMPCFPDPLALSVRNNVSFSSYLSSEREPPLQELEESNRLPQENHRPSFLQKENTSLDNSPSSQQLASFRDDMGSILSYKEVGRESLRKNWPADDYGNSASMAHRGSSPIFKNNLLPEYRSSSSGSAILSSNYHSGNPSSYPSSLEEQPLIRSKCMRNDFSSPFFSHSLNSSLGTADRTTSSFSSHHITAWTGSLLPFYSSSLNASPLDAQKLLDSDRESRNSRLSLFLRTTSSFSVSELEKTGVSADYKAKLSSNDWETSVPFRPSFFITPTSISSPRSQCDPLHDSVDSPTMGNVSLKFAFSSVGVSTLNTSDQRLNGDSMLSKTMAAECNGDKSSVSSHGRFNENVLDKNCHTPRKDSYSDREEGVGTSIVDARISTVPKEDDPSVFTCVEDISKKLNTDCDSRCQNDGSRPDKELKVDRLRQKNVMDLEHKTDGDVRKESKTAKYFRAGLVDFVKELLKPTWREGRLSKDAHNTIVKKAVDKVLSTLQPHQIPATMESIMQYLSLSQPKIAKLVEGYVDKYGKS